MPVRYAPYADARQRRKPGLAPLDFSTWIETDEYFSDQMTYRERLIDERRAVVFAETENSEPAQNELLETLLANLDARSDYDVSAAEVRRPDGVIVPLRDDPPVLTSGRLAQEDFCVLEKGAEEYVLTSAILCFPSRWSLAEKIGHPLTTIHDPVPDYTEDLAKRVNRVFEGVKTGLPLWRANWTVHDHSELHQPSGGWRKEEGGETLYIRVERQTFVRLPKTQAVVFGIRTFIDPLDNLSDEQAAALLELVAVQDADDIDYRGGEALHEKILAYLTARLE